MAFALLAAAASAAHAATEPSLVWPERGNIAAQYWVDRGGTATLEEARAAFDAGAGKQADRLLIMPLGDGHAVWYRLELPATAIAMHAVLALPYSGIDLVEFFAGASGGPPQRAGDTVPVRQWSMPYLYPVFPVTVEAGGSQVAYARVLHSQEVALRWVLWDARDFNESSKLWHLILGAGAGLMLLVFLLSVANGISWRDPIHVYYAVHVILIGTSVLSITGVAGEYLWPDHPWWNDIATVAVPAAALGWIGLLVRELVAERGGRLLSRLLLLHAAISAVIVADFLLFGRHLFFLPNLYALVSLAFILGVLVWFSVRRPKVGLWVLAGMTLLVAGALFPLLRNLGVLPLTFATQYGPQVGSALEIPLVLVGLYFRSRERRDNHLRMESLSRTDPLTGVANHRVVVERLELLLRRAQRDPQLGAVLRITVANLGQIRGEYGREAAEAALVRAAECVALEGAVSDLVGREQGGDLVLVLEGRATRPQVTEAGRNIIARGLKFSGRLPPGVTLSLRVAGVTAPLPATTATGLLGTLGTMLQELQTDPGRRAMRILEPTESGSGRAVPAGVLSASSEAARN
ncbi:7TM diverse intracellular signaling domain-containing protein [Ramlibacter sp.]|uniref:7TM diverse intracellular signaling domain-containing protein n=1 Tax=Ramlibacter sp. TaxID=1917967 RepID=UPI002B676D5F|nr:7TM diverse intracellular signaling domain-containing protein [Ramlibacter sp.]HWI80845.1 7TM diverse intracellular signaling domain-containing protein [Ramlibacter sp.]